MGDGGGRGGAGRGNGVHKALTALEGVSPSVFSATPSGLQSGASLCRPQGVAMKYEHTHTYTRMGWHVVKAECHSVWVRG